MNEQHPNNKPRRVNFMLFKEDFDCALLASLGFSTKAIVARTGLTSGKVTYRCKIAEIRRSDYRDGGSTVAALVLKNMRPVLTREVTAHIKKHL